MPQAMWFPLGRRGEFCADITVFRRSPGRAIWIWLTDLNLNNGQLGGGEGFPRSERRFLRSWPGPVYAYPWSGSLSSPARTTDRILLAAHAVEHQEWPISLAVPSGFYAPFFFFFVIFRLWPLWVQSSALGMSPWPGLCPCIASRSRGHLGGSHTLG